MEEVGWSCCGLERRVYNPVINSHVVVLIAPTYLVRQICLNHDNYHFLEIPQLCAWLRFMPYRRVVRGICFMLMKGLLDWFNGSQNVCKLLYIKKVLKQVQSN